MVKAYDAKALVEKLKAHGLNVAEEGAIAIINSTFEWVEESAAISETPYDDMALVILPKLKEIALKAADKIDGQEG